MLRQRIITGTLLILFALCVLFILPPMFFRLISALVLLYGAWEWAHLMQLKTPIAKGVYVVLMFAITVLVALHQSLGLISVVIALIWWLWHVLLVLCYPRGTVLWSNIPVKGMTGILALLPTWYGVNTLYTQSPWLLLVLFVIIWGSDTCAYTSGRLWGKKKLLPAVSPGKTWAGFWGAFVASFVIALVCVLWAPRFSHHPAFVFALFILTMLFSVLGDLVESMYKREAGLKDSGKLFPGHGGLLDRIDSLTAAAPLFLLGMIFYAHFV